MTIGMTMYSIGGGQEICHSTSNGRIPFVVICHDVMLFHKAIYMKYFYPTSHRPEELHQARGTSKVCPEALLDLVGEEAGPPVAWNFKLCSRQIMNSHDI